MERDDAPGVHRGMKRVNPTVLALLAGLIAVLLVIAYFQANRSPDQDKLSDDQVAQAGPEAGAEPESAEQRCSSRSTYDAIKRGLFRRAAELRGSDQATYDRLAGFAVLRMENPVLESEQGGTLNCSGSLSLDLPPGVAVAGGRRTLSADVDYMIDASGNVAVRNGDSITASLATLGRVEQPAAPLPEAGEIAPDTNATAPEPLGGPAAPAQPQPPRPIGARPSFDCAKASTRGEIAVCSNAGLAALDRTMAAQYSRALASASPQQRALLQQTRDRFLAYRDRCPNNACIGDAYTGRMREIRDIVEGRWQPR